MPVRTGHVHPLFADLKGHFGNTLFSGGGGAPQGSTKGYENRGTRLATGVGPESLPEWKDQNLTVEVWYHKKDKIEFEMRPGTKRDSRYQKVKKKVHSLAAKASITAAGAQHAANTALDQQSAADHQQALADAEKVVANLKKVVSLDPQKAAGAAVLAQHLTEADSNLDSAMQIDAAGGAAPPSGGSQSSASQSFAAASATSASTSKSMGEGEDESEDDDDDDDEEEEEEGESESEEGDDELDLVKGRDFMVLHTATSDKFNAFLAKNTATSDKFNAFLAKHWSSLIQDGFPVGQGLVEEAARRFQVYKDTAKAKPTPGSSKKKRPLKRRKQDDEGSSKKQRVSEKSMGSNTSQMVGISQGNAADRVSVVPVVYGKGLNPDPPALTDKFVRGDFVKMIVDPKHQNALFVFNENMEDAASKSNGGGTAKIRQYVQAPPKNGGRAIGMPTGYWPGETGGFTTLDVFEADCTEWGYNSILRVLRDNPQIEFVYYACKSVEKLDLLGTDTFTVDPRALQVISLMLQSVPHDLATAPWSQAQLDDERDRLIQRAKAKKPPSAPPAEVPTEINEAEAFREEERKKLREQHLDFTVDQIEKEAERRWTALTNARKKQRVSKTGEGSSSGNTEGVCQKQPRVLAQVPTEINEAEAFREEVHKKLREQWADVAVDNFEDFEKEAERRWTALTNARKKQRVSKTGEGSSSGDTEGVCQKQRSTLKNITLSDGRKLSMDQTIKAICKWLDKGNDELARVYDVSKTVWCEEVSKGSRRQRSWWCWNVQACKKKKLPNATKAVECMQKLLDKDCYAEIGRSPEEFLD